MSDFKAKILAELDLSKISEQIKDIAKTKIEFNNYKFDTTKLVSEIQSALSKNKFTISLEGVDTGNIAKQMQSVGTSAGKVLSNAIGSSLNKIQLKNGNIGDLKNLLQNVGFDTKSIANITQGLDKMLLTITQIDQYNLKNGNIRLTLNGVDDMNRAIQVVREFDKENRQVINTGEHLRQVFETEAQAAKRLQQEAKAAAQALALDDSKTTFARKVQNELDSLTPATEKFRADIQQIQSQIESADKFQLSHLKSEFSEITDTVRKEERAVKDAAQAHLVLGRSGTLANNIQTWMNNNTKAAEKFGDKLREIQTQLRDNTDPTVLRKLSLEFANVKSQAQMAGLATGSFAQSLKNVVLQATGFVSSAVVFRKVFQEIKQGVKTIVELDDALVDLKKTTTASASELKNFYYEANDIAKEYGATTQEIIQTTADWSRLGWIYAIKTPHMATCG